MKNYVQRGKNLSFLASTLKSVNSPVKAGDPAVIGRISGIVQDDTPNTDQAVLVTRGVFNVSVVAAGAMAAGAIVYIATATGILSDTNTGVPFGCLMTAIAGAGTVLRDVKLFGQAD